MDRDSFAFQQPWNSHLDVVSGLVRCQIRERWIPATPEELVRQTLLVWLKHACQDIYPHAIDIRVEYLSLDIAVYPRLIARTFCPAVPPILIIETKRRETHPVDTAMHREQLLGYLERTRCPTGILTNGQSWWCYQKKDAHGWKTELTDGAACIAVLKQNHQHAQCLLEGQQRLFDQATSGCFKSFTELVRLYGYGADSTITFVYEQNTIPVRAAGFLFKVTDDEVRFMLRGQSLTKRQLCTAQPFRHLVSIQSLEYQADGG